MPWALADLALHVGEMLSVPLPGSFTPAQMAHALDDAGIDAVLTDDVARARAAARLARTTALARVGPAAVPPPARPGDAVPSAPAGTRKITYTSGSTSNPKGVCLVGPGARGHRGVGGWARRASLPIERHLCILPLATLLENVAGLYAPLLRGATCVRAAERESRA